MTTFALKKSPNGVSTSAGAIEFQSTQVKNRRGFSVVAGNDGPGRSREGRLKVTEAWRQLPAKPNSGYVPLTLQRPGRGGIIKEVEEICSPVGAQSMEVKMIDTTTGNPLKVWTDGNAGPYIVAPVDQLDKVIDILESKAVPYWVDEEAISIDGKPEEVVINLGSECEPDEIQGFLDNEI